MTTTIERPRNFKVPPMLFIPEIEDDVTRRQFLIGAGSMLLLAPYGCNTESGQSGTTSGGRTIEHKFGSTEVPANPQRVVTVGLTEQDTLLALGITPVAARKFGGSVIRPWNEDEFGDAEPKVLSGPELDFERIAGLEPDLVVGVYSGMTEEEYDTLSKIAPTVAPPDGYNDFGVPWQEQTRMIGRALGRKDRAEELVDDLEARFAKVRDQHPEFVGVTAVVVQLFEEGSYNAYASQDLRSRFMRALGFRIPSKFDELAGDNFYASISFERLELVDSADVVVWAPTAEELAKQLQNNPIYQQLDVAQEGRDVFLPASGTLIGALSFSTVLSLPFALDELVPMLATAIDGDPDTEVTSPS